MQKIVYCKETTPGTHSFYIESDGRTYFLFCQDFRKGVDDYYSGGVSLKDALDHSKSRRDNGITHTMNKLPAYIRYIEKEEGARILDKTCRKMRKAA